MTNSSYFRRFGACVTVLTALGLASCKSDSNNGNTPTVAQTVFVVSADNPQSRLLTEIYAQSLEKSGFRVSRRDPVADLAAGYALLKAGTADLFVTHTAELLDYLAATEPAASSTSTTEAATTTSAPEATTTSTADTTDSSTGTTGDTSGTTADSSSETSTTLFDATSTTLFDATSTTVATPGQAAATSINLQSNLIGEILPDNLQVGAASDAEDKSVIACGAAVSTTGMLTNLSEVARAADVLRLAGPESFKTDTVFGLPGFEKVYGATFKDFIVTDPAKIGEAITPPTTTTDPSASTTTVAPTSTTTPTSTGDTAADTTTTTTTPANLLADADCGAFNSLDVTMPNDAVIMDDDKNWIETNGVIPIMTKTAFTPGVQQVVDQVSQQLTTSDLHVMLSAMSSEPASPESMASRYISSKASTGS